MAVVLVIEPIFDEDMPPEQHTPTARTTAPTRRCGTCRAQLDQGRTEVVDADLSGYFDSIPHHELMQSVARRISDGRLLHLMKMWLEAAVRGDGRTRKKKFRTARSKDEGRGTPQGGGAGPPLLANLYMRRFVLGWKVCGHERRPGRSHRELRGRLSSFAAGRASPPRR